jgi:hypothetical protein
MLQIQPQSGATQVLGLTDSQLDEALTAACRAPSLHNSQPWAFRIAEEAVYVHLDRDRRLPATDPEDREARIACGAALFNLRLALIGYGVRPSVTLLPTGAEGAMAVVHQQGRTSGTPEFLELRRAIPERRTHRRPFVPAEVPLELERLLADAVRAEGAVLHLISAPAAAGQLQRLAVAAHRAQLADPAWTAEWNAWTHRIDTPDGVPVSAAGPVPAPQDRWTLRDFGTPGRPERVEGKDFEDEPLIAVIATSDDSALAQLRAGQALQRMLLTATNWGMSASFVSQLIEVHAARREVRTLIGDDGHPQVVLRMGFGSPIMPTPRRAVADCLLSP